MRNEIFLVGKEENEERERKKHIIMQGTDDGNERLRAARSQKRSLRTRPGILIIYIPSAGVLQDQGNSSTNVVETRHHRGISQTIVRLDIHPHHRLEIFVTRSQSYSASSGRTNYDGQYWILLQRTVTHAGQYYQGRQPAKIDGGKRQNKKRRIIFFGGTAREKN